MIKHSILLKHHYIAFLTIEILETIIIHNVVEFMLVECSRYCKHYPVGLDGKSNGTCELRFFFILLLKSKDISLHALLLMLVESKTTKLIVPNQTYDSCYPFVFAFKFAI